MEVEIEIDEAVFLECYRPLRFTVADIIFLYGGRDSGKSYFIAQHMVELCLSLDYFKCVLVRKNYNSIKESQYELIQSIVRAWGLEDYFIFRKNPLEIECVNGNRFIAKGCDNPENVKSIVNPSHAWYEEGNQLEADDYTTVSTTLRNNEGNVQEWFSFNPECSGDFRDFWIYKNNFSHTGDKSFVYQKSVTTDFGEVNFNVIAIHTTYANNPHCTATRAAKLEDLKKTSPYYYRIFCLGEWGVRENKDPFFVSFNRQKHVGSCKRVHGPVYLSFDFNRNPMCCVIAQQDFARKKVRFLEVIKLPNSSIQKVCELISLKYPGSLFIACGDYAGTQRRGEIENTDFNSYWKVIKAKLALNDGQMQYIVNPSIEENQVLVNYCLEHLDVLMDEQKCQPLIFDMQFAELLPTGKLKKGSREDPTQQLDVADAARYLFNRYWGHLINETAYKKR